MDTYETVTAALDGLKEKGYVEDFNLRSHCINCTSLNLDLPPSDFVIDEFYRFEGSSNPDDSSIVFAISSKDGIKGTLVDAFGVYADSLNEEMIKKLRIAR